jgi:pimeloyl-ACP methyl ester carboxylesterase
MQDVSHADVIPSHLLIPERSVSVNSSKGVVLSVTDWGRPDDRRPALLMAHATGMHGHAWLPTAIALSDRFRCVAVDQRAQGNSTVPTVGDLNWPGVADDIEIAMGALGLLGRTDVYGIGHSQGGYAVLETERRRPGTFAGLFIYEPIVFADHTNAESNGPGTGAGTGGNPLASLTRRRRRTFDSWEATVENFRGKGPFAAIDDDVLQSYVYWGFLQLEDGSVTLRCDPENEASLYDLSGTDLFEHADRVTCPTTVAVGSNSGPNFEVGTKALAERLPRGRLLPLTGRSHFGIFEGVTEMANIIAMSLLGEAGQN